MKSINQYHGNKAKANSSIQQRFYKQSKTEKDEKSFPKYKPDQNKGKGKKQKNKRHPNILTLLL